MDIAAFVGFAAAGPLHRPVAIEDPGEFTNVFGQDLPLAWDPERGEVENAYLAPAVRAFFRNGGRRCWVIRVADTPRTVGRLRPPNGRPAARSNTYPLVGLVGLALDTGAGRQASVVARSEGSWSDGVRVGAELEVEPLSILASLQDAAGTVQIAADAQTNIAPGDLVRLTFVESDYVVLLGVETLLTEPRGLPLSPLDLHGQGQWAGGSQAWFSARIPPDLASRATSARVFDGAAEPTPLLLVGSGLNTQTGALVLRLAVDAGELPGVGTLVHVEFGTSPRQTAWLTVADVVPPGGTGSPVQHLAEISGTGLLRLDQPPRLPPHPGRIVAERLTMSLIAELGFERWSGQANTYPMRLQKLGFGQAHPRYWGNLPVDTDLYVPPDEPVALTPETVALRNDVRTPRFPLAGSAEPGLMYLPLGIRQVLDRALLCGPYPAGDTPLERDGLTAFGADLFIDGDLSDADVLALPDQADFLRYQQPVPRSLTGMHAVLGLGEPSLLAIPDAVHRGWVRDVRTGRPVEVQQASPIQPDECMPPIPSPGAPGQFTCCDLLPAPVLSDIEPPSEPSYDLTWSTPGGADIRYTLEESTANTFADSAVVYRGTAATVRLQGRAEGRYFYRVRAESTSTPRVSAWSNIVGVRSGVSIGWRVLAPNEFVSDPLETIHLAMLTLGGATGDVQALLSLPVHYREDDAIRHVNRLSASLTFDRDRTLSFGALYHPWPISRDESVGDVRQSPPDGTLGGIIAARALVRGAWIAPANEPLQGVLALAPPLAAARRLDLQEGSVNVLRQQPDGFRVLCANTLSTDESVRPINVRRLMSLLRRLALREGARYVFEPNDDGFRRLVERGFETLLEDLYTLGAFAGATPEAAFQVNTAGAVNTPRDRDAGRFIVELKVAPSRPLTFLTIRLLQQGQRELTIVEG
jgi:hypothetical protein